VSSDTDFTTPIRCAGDGTNVVTGTGGDIMTNDKEEKTERVYQREVTISFTRPDYEDLKERRANSSLAQRSLAQQGILIHNYDSGRLPAMGEYGLQPTDETERTRHLLFANKRISLPSTVSAQEAQQIADEIAPHYKDGASIETLTETTTTEVYRIRAQNSCYINTPALLPEHDYDATTVGDTMRVAQDGVVVDVSVKCNLNPYAGVWTMMVTLIWEAEAVQRVDAIKHALTDVPEAVVAAMQAAFTVAVDSVGGDTSEPGFDCVFTANIETVSACAPDIIAQMEKARMARLGA
jgi:hypothetical protein